MPKKNGSTFLTLIPGPPATNALIVGTATGLAVFGALRVLEARRDSSGGGVGDVSFPSGYPSYGPSPLEPAFSESEPGPLEGQGLWVGAGHGVPWHPFRAADLRGSGPRRAASVEVVAH